MKTITHKVDFCVVGGGLAGMLAAISAARRGAKVALMQDRPVLGGNCSSEIRMWALGCHGKNNRESGILEEILLENMHRNPDRNFSIWDSILYEKARFEPNIDLILNCSCQSAETVDGKIVSVTGWQLTTYTYHKVEADLFADCSGDSVLAPLTGAEFRVGREARAEYDESIAPIESDARTMGMSCLLQAKETNRKVDFIAPDWAYVYHTDEELGRHHGLVDCKTQNFWWIELGGEVNSIDDTETLRDELLKITFGVWDHIKNRGDHGADNWELDWVGFLPGKRESRRYVGDHVLSQNEVAAGGKFDDLVAYGGWTMDDHDPTGFYGVRANVFHPAPCPYGIPYRSLYSRNIDNLLFAGRNISATHAAISSTRVMATCAVIGQAVGTAASIAVKYGVNPRGVYERHLSELQQSLMDDDCYLPFHKRGIGALSRSARVTDEVLRNGLDRPIGDEDNGYYAAIGEAVGYAFDKPVRVSSLRVVFDSDLERTSCDGDELLRNYPMLANKYRDMLPFGFPKTMTKAFRVDYRDEKGNMVTLFEEGKNRKRLVVLPADVVTDFIVLVPLETYGSEKAHIFSFDLA